MKKLKENTSQSTIPVLQAGKKTEEDPVGYPTYLEGDDIYKKYKEEKDINPENISENKDINEVDNTDPNNEKKFGDDSLGNDLDVPGSELDDAQEKVGSEDEENNYYSLGGDDHNDLDED
jgi:hypothetical protein